MPLQGCDINKYDSHGTSPLLAALESELPAISRLLIERGADVNMKRFDFVTPLHMAIQVRGFSSFHFILRVLTRFLSQAAHVDLAELLVSHGADVKAKTVEGFSCLHFATEIGSFKLIELCVQNLGITFLHHLTVSAD